MNASSRDETGSDAAGLGGALMSSSYDDLAQIFVDNLKTNAAKNEVEMVLAPSLANVRAACEEFDRQERIIEAALAELFTAYPQNTTAHHVLLRSRRLTLFIPGRSRSIAPPRRM
jgi:hypothetical protein